MNKLEQLKALLTHKKSKAYYAERLGVTELEVDDLLRELRTGESANYVYRHDLGDVRFTDWKVTHTNEFTKKENVEKGTLETTSLTDFEPKSIEQLVELHKIDTTRYKVSSYWTKQRGTKFFASLFCTLIKEDSQERIKQEFEEFLETYEPRAKKQTGEIKFNKNLPASTLVLPKQDAHFNKYDIGGDNYIESRFERIYDATVEMVNKAKQSTNLHKVIYIVGSDQFNSEWTSLTTKGTPQQNILNFHEAFEKICQHEVNVISKLNELSPLVDILFIPGNHDQYVGWHLVKWLEVYFKDNFDIKFDTQPSNRKYIKFGSSSIMFNHGDEMKPNDLAHVFPIEFRAEWGSSEFYYIFTGDKHHEMSKDIHGIKFYQVPQLSSAKSGWDDKKGYTISRAEMQSFLITDWCGMTDVYKTVFR